VQINWGVLEAFRRKAFVYHASVWEWFILFFPTKRGIKLFINVRSQRAALVQPVVSFSRIGMKIRLAFSPPDIICLIAFYSLLICFKSLPIPRAQECLIFRQDKQETQPRASMSDFAAVILQL
jgi:hypothetical protein